MFNLTQLIVEMQYRWPHLWMPHKIMSSIISKKNLNKHFLDFFYLSCFKIKILCFNKLKEGKLYFSKFFIEKIFDFKSFFKNVVPTIIEKITNSINVRKMSAGAHNVNTSTKLVFCGRVDSAFWFAWIFSYILKKFKNFFFVKTTWIIIFFKTWLLHFDNSSVSNISEFWLFVLLSELIITIERGLLLSSKVFNEATCGFWVVFSSTRITYKLAFIVHKCIK